MRRVVIALAALGAAAGLLILAASQADQLAADSCPPPAAILAASQQDALDAVDRWVELEVAPGWDVVKHPGLVDVSVALTEQAEQNAFAKGLNPSALHLDVTVFYDGLKDPFFGALTSAKAWKQYAVVVSRECAGGDWVVNARLVKEGTADKGGGRAGPVGSVGVPDAS